MLTPTLLHIPHSSASIPERLRKDFCCDVGRELLAMTDWYTDDLFDLPAEALIFPVSRLVCDVERFRSDEEEEMARIGMGAVYTSTHRMTPLRIPDREQREEILKEWYDPHHEALNGMVGERLARFGRCLIVDCHSFSPHPLPYERDQTPDRPEICIGTDPFHTPERLVSRLEEDFRTFGCRVARDRPYAGAMVPNLYYKRDPRVAAVMVEVNRGLYLEGGSRKGAGYRRTKEMLARVLLPWLTEKNCLY